MIIAHLSFENSAENRHSGLVQQLELPVTYSHGVLFARERLAQFTDCESVVMIYLLFI